MRSRDTRPSCCGTSKGTRGNFRAAGGSFRGDEIAFPVAAEPSEILAMITEALRKVSVRRLETSAVGAERFVYKVDAGKFFEGG